ncbi:MAG TPA: FtsX-like permease family protein [Dyadobacter sp.]|jgi:putative ABC transport system permease protein|nr:FtsX-like permease family protein [Dyadobacter sp.]
MLKNYIKITLRTLRRNLSYTILNVAGLGMGMACATLIFVFLQYHLTTDRHQPDFDRTYRVVLNLLLDEGTEHGVDSSVPFAASLAHDYAQVEKVGFIRKNPNATISATDGNETKRFVEKDNVVFANQDFMEMFSYNWLGKNAAVTMNEPGIVIISESIAEKYFGTKDAIGRTLTLANAVNLRITGIVKNQDSPTDNGYGFYISLPTLKLLEPDYEMDNFGWLSSRNVSYIRLVAGTEQHHVENEIKKNCVKYYGETAKYYDHKLQPLVAIHFDERYDGKIRMPILWMLGCVGIFLLVIACINFVNMATARALRRSKEIGVRKILGSTQRQLFFQFMSETAVVTLGGAILAILLVALFLPILKNWSHLQLFQFTVLFQLQFLLFVIFTILLVILLAGFYPAVIISGFNPVAALSNKVSTRQLGGIVLRRSLVVFQLIVAQVLVIGTIVLVLQLDYFQNADLGFDKNAVISIPLPKINPERNVRESLKNDLLQYPSVRSVAYQFEAPSSQMGYGGSVRFDNRVEWEKFVIRDRFGDSGYIPTYKMQLLAGRNIADRDSVTEFVVNEELMLKLGIKDPQQMLGRSLEDGNSGLKGEIVGVVKSFHLKSLQEAKEPCVIFANPKLYKQVAVKLNPENIAGSISKLATVWQKNFPDEVFNYQFVDEQVTKFYEKEQQLAQLIRVFALVAILICCLGLYGMVNFMVGQRTKEIGVRKVLGAGIDSITMLFGREFIALVVFAFAVAAPVAWYIMTAWLNGFAYRIALEWWIVGSGGIIILLFTAATVGYRVVRAAIMDPVNSLRVE